MKVNSSSQSTTFKAKGNVEDYLHKITLSNNSEITDLRQIRTSLRKESLSRVHEKREVVQQKETQVFKAVESSLDSIINSINNSLDRINDSAQGMSVGLTSCINSDGNSLLLSEFKHGTNYLFEGISGKPFENTMQRFDVKTANSMNIDEQRVLTDLRKIFLEFRDVDTALINNYLKQFVAVSNKYFTQNSQDFKNIRDIQKLIVKFAERIPLAGLMVRTERVQIQQMAAQKVYEDFQGYNNVVITEGINSVIFSYIDKLNGIKNYTKSLTPYLSNSGNEFLRNFNSQLEKVAERPLKSYQRILSSLAINCESIKFRCDKIINAGDLSVVRKAFSTCVTLGVI